ncbi:unnamed protein product [Brassicogethes aeneus]|uniref:Uncharacterized protein n=1 Tax=Brassicogethes aeneus TaxID=1431903 RepID=A0A9P0BED6_BRAAE|nr:unnamed protein product [Brassicogethes aeneus]
MSDERPVPKGRGAALLAALKRREEKEVGVQPPVPKTPEEPPKPRGRAAMLAMLKERQQQVVGQTPPKEVQEVVKPSKPVQEVTKAMSEVSVSEETVSFKGDHGKQLRISANYIRLECDPKRGVFEYEVRFEPEVDAKNRRMRLVNQIIREMGQVKVFDGGAKLYLPDKITDSQKVFKMTLPEVPDTEFNVIITFQKQKKMYDRDSLHLYNVLFKRIMHILLYTQMGRNYFNTHHKYLIPQHKLEVFPGFAVSVDEQEGGLLLCLDTQHRVLRQQNAYELLTELRSMDPKRFKEAANQSLIGSCIFTRYNNKTYTVDDIAWETTPRDTFPTRDGNNISFMEYYKKQHNLTIADEYQPLLINKRTVKVAGSAQKEDIMICLVPELCYLTGLTDVMRNDFKVMKDVAQYTRVTPAQRLMALKTYLKNIRESEKAQQVLSEWGLRLGSGTIDTYGRQLDNELIYFGGNQIGKPTNADWNRDVGNNKVTGPVDMINWIVFFTQRDRELARRFQDLMQKLGDVMGCRIASPKPVELPNDRTESYMTACKDNIKDSTQVVVFIVPSIRGDRYAVIKKMCCSQIPTPSQVVTARVLQNQAKVRSIVQKIALQMVAKMGGTLWNIKLPFKGWMVAGVDVYHGGQSSTCGFVCSLNETLTRYMTMVNFQDKEIGDYYKMAFTKSLERYKTENGTFPERVIIYRDGVGDGQLDYVKRYEIEQFSSVLKQFGLETKLCFIVVQKRINTKIFEMKREGAENPPPGTVVDHTFTRRTMKDFFLISQNVRQGTVNPTHYIVVRDDANMTPDVIQRLSYKMCHLYYNWAGTTRVPAPCQYAHKAAGLVGQHIKKIPDPSLSDKLYFL